MSTRRWWVSDKEPLSIARAMRTCVCQSFDGIFLPSIVLFPDAEKLPLLELIDKEYTRHPFYGSRKIMHYLRNEGHKINRKRVQRLMRMLGLAGMAPGPNTSKPHPENKIYPYLLRGVDVTKPNYCHVMRIKSYKMVILFFIINQPRFDYEEVQSDPDPRRAKGTGCTQQQRKASRSNHAKCFDFNGM